MPKGSILRLPLIGPGDALAGVATAAFERLSKTCQVGDAVHVGLVRTAALVAHHGLRRSIAPSARQSPQQALEQVEAWTATQRGLKQLQAERSRCFAQVDEIERVTLQALSRSIELGGHRPPGLAQHAQSVVQRYVRLSARLATEAVLLTVDGVTDTEQLAHVVQQVAAARAYQAVGLATARQPELLDKAIDQAQREAERTRHAQHSDDLLALQIFHEYLGVRWKVLHDAERVYIDQFVDWAVAGASRPLH